MRDFPQLHYKYFLKTEIQVRINDIDLLGHVNNAIWQEYFDVARIHYFNDILGSIRFDGEDALVIANVNTNYMSSLFFKDKVWIETKVSQIGTKSLKMYQLIKAMRKDTEILAGVSEATMVCVNRITNKSSLIPDRWRKQINDFEQDLTF